MNGTSFECVFILPGQADGSVCVWDLREPSSMHLKCEFGWGHIMVRVPTYSTEAGSPDESHHSRVVAMQPIVSADDAQKATSKSNFGGKLKAESSEELLKCSSLHIKVNTG